MPINPNAVEAAPEQKRVTWTSKDAILYALGCGAGPEALTYVTEKDQRVLPSFATVIGTEMSLPKALGDVDLTKIVQAEQSILLSAPLPPSGEVLFTRRVSKLYDTERFAIAAVETSGTLAGEDKPLFVSEMTMALLGDSGFGGPAPPPRPKAMPTGDPDQVLSFAVKPDQALIYRLSGDLNPLHYDPDIAARIGFDQPILHGLCTYGICGRLLLKAYCGGDDAKFGRFYARFKHPVFPGDQLDVQTWKTEDAVLFHAKVADRTVLEGGKLELL